MPSVSSIEEASRALAAAHAADRRMTIGRELQVTGLDRVLEHDPGDLTCTVEGGLRLSVLQAALAERGQRLSLDPPGDPTIGALVATNVSGPLRHRFGAPRDLVLGVTLVLADGTVASAGGKVVKNVAGYDLARLVCGSRGRFGLVARASFRLHPLPQASRAVVVEAGDTAEAVALVLGSQLQPSAVDVLHPGRLALLFEGSERAVEAQAQRTRSLVGGVDADPAVWEESRALQAASPRRRTFVPGELGSLLRSLGPALVRPSAGVAYVADGESVATPASPTAVEALVERIARELDPRGVFAG